MTGLPPTSIVLSEYDDLRATQLEESGVPVRTCLARGLFHGHMNGTRAAGEVASSFDFFAAALTTASAISGPVPEIVA